MKPCPTCGLPVPESGFRVDYLCVLDSGCSGRSHSIRCQDLNSKHARILISKERERRIALIEAEVRAWDR